MPPDTSIYRLIGGVLLAWAVIIVVAQGVGVVFKKLRQPAVMGEVIGGILLGPSFLGVFFPQAKEFLFSPAVILWIGHIAQWGIVFYMFLVGLDFDWSFLKESGRRTFAISQVSILAPFLLGLAFAWQIPAELAQPAVNPWHSALFIGVAMSVTAFPVLARILSDTGLRRTPLGNLALACAAINDVTAWCLLALVVSLTEAKPENGVFTALLTIVYIAAMFVVVRPLLKKSAAQKTIVLVALLALSAFITDTIGIHALFGAFLLGAIVPRESKMTAVFGPRMENLVRIFLLPTFFALTGMRTQINLMNSPRDWMWCAIVIALATAGKLGGAALTAKLTGFRWRESLALGALMNTRGLVELIVLNAGYDLHLLSAKLFTIMVVMAVVTTLMASPLLHAFRRADTAQLRE